MVFLTCLLLLAGTIVLPVCLFSVSYVMLRIVLSIFGALLLLTLMIATGLIWLIPIAAIIWLIICICKFAFTKKNK